MPLSCPKEPPAPGVTSAGPGLGPKASNSRTNPPLPKPAPRALGGRDSLPPPITETAGLAGRRRVANNTPHSHPSHDLKRKKWCHGPQPHFLSLGSPSAPFNLNPRPRLTTSKVS